MKDFLNYVKKNPFQFIAILLCCIVSIAGMPLGYGLVSLIPTAVLIALIYYSHEKTTENEVKLGCGALIVCALIVIFQLILAVFMYSDISAKIEEANWNNPKNYVKNITKLKYSNENVNKIFPNTLPQNVQNYKSSKEASGLVYREIPQQDINDFKFSKTAGGLIDFRATLDLSFTANSKYIAEEQQRLNKIIPMPFVIDTDTTAYYKIVDEYDYPDNNHENYFKGYCYIDKDSNKISYYYEEYYGDTCSGCYKDQKRTGGIDFKTIKLIHSACRGNEKCIKDAENTLESK